MSKVTVPSQLMARIADGDENAFEELYRLTYKPLFSFILSLTADEEKTRDIMQETYLNVYMSASRYRDKGNPLAWIMKIGKNIFLMEKRRKDSNIIFMEDPDSYVPGISYDSIENIEARETLQMLFESLTLQERSIVTLHDLSGFRHREIADILELPIGTVLSKYHRAVGKLKKKAQTEILGKEKN